MTNDLPKIFNPNDPRHGTPAGAAAHRRTGNWPCTRCEDAEKKARQEYYQNRKLAQKAS